MGLGEVGDPSSTQLLTAVKWAVENDMFLTDFVQRSALPHLALVTKGQYLSIGAPNVANPSLKPYVLVHSTHKVRKVLAQLLRVNKDGKRKLLTEHKVAIPESYSGYFEILSEDGRPVKCLETVMDLCKKFPELCLVRTSCKAYVPDGDGELRSLYRTRNLQEGEVLTLVGQFNFKRIIFLRCFDETGHSVYLKLSQKGKFSPVARPDSITGVHSIENLMNKRLPLLVKLIQGSYPPDLSKFVGANSVILQLQNVFVEEVVFVQSLLKNDGQFFALPINAHIRLAPALNHPHVRTRSEFQRLCTRCEDGLSDFFNKMTTFNDHQFVYDNAEPSIIENALSTLGDEEKDCDNHVSDDEIDKLYDYIRGGPLPPSCQRSLSPLRADNRGVKPNPPPIETMPSRKSEDSSNSRSGLVQMSPIMTPGTRSPMDVNTNGTKNSSGSPQSMTTSPTGTTLIVPEQRLDEMVYGGHNGHKMFISDKRRISKSTEKLSIAHSPPSFFAPHARAPVSQNHQPAQAHLPNGHQVNNGQTKRRPLSMVVPDNMQVFTQRISGHFVPPDMYAHHFGRPSAHFQPYQHQHPMYHSFMNLSMAEEQEPPPAYSPAPQLQAHQGAYGPTPPPPYSGFNGARAVYPRYVPRYQYQPVYRV